MQQTTNTNLPTNKIKEETKDGFYKLFRLQPHKFSVSNSIPQILRRKKEPVTK